MSSFISCFPFCILSLIPGFSEPLGFEKLALPPAHPLCIERCVGCWPVCWPSDMQGTQSTTVDAMGAKKEFYAQFFMEILPVSYQNQDLTLLLFVFRYLWSKMTITWQEHEHEEEDMLALHDPVTVNALRNCGLLKFFRISSMRQQINLL